MKKIVIVTGILCCMVMIGVFYAAPNQKGEYLLAQNMEGSISKEVSERVKEECLEVAGIYKETYFNTDKQPSDIVQADKQISEEAVGEIVKKIGKRGITVSDTAGRCSLENTEAFYSFWEKIQKGEAASVTIYRIRQNGGFYRYEFYMDHTGKYLLSASVNLDLEGNPDVYEMKITPLSEWKFTEKENFIFRDDYAVWASGNGYRMIRVKPVDENCLSYQKKYVEPINYGGNNLMISNWSETDYSKLSFNDLFENLYNLKEGKRLEKDQFPIDPSNENRYIPADLFENVIQSYFSITKEDLRKAAMFEQKRDAYPWQEIRSNNNCVAMPYMDPDVTAVKKNSDGTVTLTIDVICLEKSNDRAFTHVLTLRELGGGKVQYAANAIVPDEHNVMPNYVYRLQ